MEVQTKMGEQHFQMQRRLNIERVHIIIKQASLKNQITDRHKLYAVCAIDLGLSEKKVEEYLTYLKYQGLVVEDSFGLMDKSIVDLSRQEIDKIVGVA